MSIDIELSDVKVTDVSDTDIVKNKSVEVSNSVVEPRILDNESIVEGYKKEYSIVGDGLYASVSAEDAPAWLTAIIDSVIGMQLDSGLLDIREARNSILAALAEIDVAKNQYQELINIDDTIESVIASRLTTLNATVGSNSASILNLSTTKVDEERALAISADHLSAEILDGSVRSLVTNLNTAIADVNYSLANSVDMIEADFESLDGVVQSNAVATNALYTYVGIDSAGASTSTGLSAYLADADGNIGGATSEVANSVYVDGSGNPKSKFEYGSQIYKNGNYYIAGFGLNLDASAGVGTIENPYSSEFWINAEKFKFTNDAQSGQTAPFSIDASGVTPQVSFNGIVSFSNITNVPALGSTPQEVVNAVNSGSTTTIDGGKITAGSLNVGTAEINDAAITNAKIGDAAISSAKIANAAITNAKIGGVIQSDNFVSGSSGWLIDKAGNAEFTGFVKASGVSRVMVANSATGVNVTTSWADVVNITYNNPFGTRPFYLIASLGVTAYRTEGSYIDLSARLLINGSVVSKMSAAGTIRSAITVSGGNSVTLTGTTTIQLQVYSGTANDGITDGGSGFILAVLA